MVVHVAPRMVNGHGAYILLLLSIAICLDHTPQVVVILAIDPGQIVQVVAIGLHDLIAMSSHAIASPRIRLIQLGVRLDSIPGIVSQLYATHTVGMLDGWLRGQVTPI